MILAFILYKYFPFGGLQRDFLHISLECQKRGHSIRVYTLTWKGEIPKEFNVCLVPVHAVFNHTRNLKFTDWVHEDLTKNPVDCIIGFNKMPGLDIYYAADSCFEDKSQTLYNFLYRYGSRYRHFYSYERAVFKPTSKTKILLISDIQHILFMKYYRTQIERFYFLPPGINKNYIIPIKKMEKIRNQFRNEFMFKENDLLMIQIGSGFKIKGLDRTLKALAALPKKIKKRTKLIVIGEDHSLKFYIKMLLLGIYNNVHIFKGRNDIIRFLIGTDLLIHPAYNENTGTVLLEALVVGLPVLVTDICGYAHYINEAKAGYVLKTPFKQKILNTVLAKMLINDVFLKTCKINGLHFSKKTDLYSMPRRAAEIIIGLCKKNEKSNPK